MFRNVTPEKAMVFIRYSISLICAWPLPSTATKAQILYYRFFKVLSGISVIGLLIPLINAAIIHFGDATQFSKAFFMAIACAHGVTQIVVTSIQHDRYQIFIEDIIDSLKNAKTYERNVYQRYVDTYGTFYALTVIWCFSTPLMVAFESMLLPQPFPTISEYPFRVDNKFVQTTIIVHQTFVGLQCAAAVSGNMFAAFLILYAVARYELVMIDLREATSVDTLIMCVKKYYSVTRCAKDITDATQYIVWFTILYGSVGLVLCGLNIVGREPFVVKVPFIAMALNTLMEAFMCALPADSLINASTDAVRSAYESTWYDQLLEVQKTVHRIMIPQSPVIISLKCLIPRLSLEYYCSYISSSITLFTVMRMVFGEDADFLSSKSTNNSSYVN